MDFQQKCLELRKAKGGLWETALKVKVENQDDLSTVYTPGIAAPCRAIAKDPALARVLTQKRNTVAVISDGSAVLGLGNIGPQASLPVMEGKCMLLKAFADVDAMPIVLDTQDTEEIIRTIIHMAPTFGGINLEDIAAPRCFEIEARLTKALDIPVFHDDQHGTAMVALAALKNALKVVGKSKTSIKVVIAGAGAAGMATAKLWQAWGIGNIIMTDSKGIIDCDREELSDPKKAFCTYQEGTIKEALVGADVFIGLSNKPDMLDREMVRSMNPEPIIFAMANPDPEILPPEAKAGGAAIIATGRSDFPNQINNVLIFPGLFRGLLDAGITKIDTALKLRVAEGLADIVEHPTAEYIIPSAFDKNVVKVVSQAVIYQK